MFKIAENNIKKEASYRIFKSFAKALKQGLFGNREVMVENGAYLADRLQAQHLYDDVIKNTFSPFRARVASPESIPGKLKKKGVLNDTLGVQILARKNPDEKIQEVVKKFKALDGSEPVIKKHNKEGYYGVNINSVVKGVPVEVQLSPGIRANIGQILQHDAFKPPDGFTELDIKISDALGKFLIKSGVKGKPQWKFLN